MLPSKEMPSRLSTILPPRIADEISWEATGWQAHTVPSFLRGALINNSRSPLNRSGTKRMNDATGFASEIHRSLRIPGYARWHYGLCVGHRLMFMYGTLAGARVVPKRSAKSLLTPFPTSRQRDQFLLNIKL
jgi:hypothetical protein